MKAELAQEIIACLPTDRTLFWYYKDYYAVYLLHRELSQHGARTVSKLRKGRFGRLLRKPIFTELLAKSGSGKLCASDIENRWSQDYEPYVLTLSTWGNEHAKRYRYYQVSRPGKNLVLQMNFCSRHDALYRQYIHNDMDYFKCLDHPVSRDYCTLAWARIDLDLTTGEALIEEIQNDWLRDMDYLARYVKRCALRGHASVRLGNWTLDLAKALIYLESEIARHKVIWSEAMLSAAIKFLHEEIGIKRIYYHSPDTGAAMKNIRYSKPPRSIYKTLPKQFCFESVNEAPSFIARDKQAKRRIKTMKNQQWFCMAA